MASISLKNIVKRYGTGKASVPVIHGVSADIKDGEFIVLVGPSGCGKSTLLRMIAGLEEITDGDLLIGSNKVNDLEPAKRNIAMVFQNYALYPHMSNYENMAYGLKLAKVPEDEIKRRVDKAAKILELSHLLEPYPQELINVPVQRKIPFSDFPEIVNAVTAVEAELAGRGRVLLRYSGTENKARVMVEGESAEQVRRIAEELAALVKKCLA